ncbi:MAG: FUSC family protein [Actinobacteria bacterium]|nr:FUSC family protein [Actinomycetota bacterium]
MLTFVLPVTLPAPNSAIPDRLEGWGLAAGVGITAVMLLWPARRRRDLRKAAAGTLRTVADFMEAPRAELAVRADSTRKAVDDLGRAFLGSQHRPTGPEAPTAALSSLPDELDWLISFLSVDAIERTTPESEEALAASASVLRAGADRLDGDADARPDFARLDAARSAVARAVLLQLADLSDLDALDPSFRIRALTYSARQVASYALIASGGEAPDLDEIDIAPAPSARGALRAAEQLAVEHASIGSVWLQNSLRGAAGLAIAVFIAQKTGLQHGFWVVLGTLSVLRSNALGTGWSILSALAGTAVGLVVGALLVIGIGTHETVLWAVLPFAIVLAAYAPRAISFAAGQAGFTVVLFILFNIIQPVGWRVGVVRLEDVAIGFGISLGVGLLFWPRGAGALLRRNLASAYGAAADYVVATTRNLIGEADDGARAARAADGALHRLDDAFRQYLTERSATEFNLEDVAGLVGAASRVRRAAQSLESLARMAGKSGRLGDCGRNLDGELNALHSWFVSLGYALENVRPVPPPHVRDADGRARLVECVRAGARSHDKATLHAAFLLLAASQHLDNLYRLEGRLQERVNTARAASPFETAAWVPRALRSPS